MKNCPFCWEKIQDIAKKCRFCGEWLQEWNKEEVKIEKKVEKIKISGELWLWKRIVANIIDIIATYIFWIWFIINIYLYYSASTTIWLKIFWSQIIDKKTKEIPNGGSLTKRFFTKYFWLFLGVFIILFIINLLMPVIMSVNPGAIALLIIVYLIWFWGFLYYLGNYYNKNNTFWREKSSNTEIIYTK